MRNTLIDKQYVHDIAWLALDAAIESGSDTHIVLAMAVYLWAYDFDQRQIV